jgi:hypothetical protein
MLLDSLEYGFSRGDCRKHCKRQGTSRDTSIPWHRTLFQYQENLARLQDFVAYWHFAAARRMSVVMAAVGT